MSSMTVQKNMDEGNLGEGGGDRKKWKVRRLIYDDNNEKEKEALMVIT